MARAPVGGAAAEARVLIRGVEDVIGVSADDLARPSEPGALTSRRKKRDWITPWVGIHSRYQALDTVGDRPPTMGAL